MKLQTLMYYNNKSNYKQTFFKSIFSSRSIGRGIADRTPTLLSFLSPTSCYIYETAEKRVIKSADSFYMPLRLIRQIFFLQSESRTCVLNTNCLVTVQLPVE